jgi:hypothetical protein
MNIGSFEVESWPEWTKSIRDINIQEWVSGFSFLFPR